MRSLAPTRARASRVLLTAVAMLAVVPYASHANADERQACVTASEKAQQLRSAGKSSELIVYKDLDHGLLDSTVRAEVLRKSDAFLRKYLKL